MHFRDVEYLLSENVKVLRLAHVHRALTPRGRCARHSWAGSHRLGRLIGRSRGLGGS